MNLNGAIIKDVVVYFISNIGGDFSDLLKCNYEIVKLNLFK